MNIEVDARIIIELEQGISETRANEMIQCIEKALKENDYWRFASDIELDVR